MQPEQQQRIMGYFIEEAKEHLNTIEQGLLNLQSTLNDPEMTNELFRAAHSVKGGAAMLGLNSIQRVSHRLEDFFKVLKDSPVKVDQKLETLFLQVFDALQDLLTQLQSPFGLSEDTANATVAGVEPSFTELEQHLNALASGTPVPSVVASAPVEPVRTATVARPESALVLLFSNDIPVRLREMLQLFKQSEADPSVRQALQSICRNFISIGEQFELPDWCRLVGMASRAIANPDHSYRTLAPIVIKDIKQAQELVLSGRSAEIYPCIQLQDLVPASEALPQPDESSDFLMTDEPDFAAVKPLDLAAAGESEPMFDQFDFAESLETAGSPSIDPFTSGFRGERGGEADHNGPEVGIAELNSLADLFEGEVPDLGSTWQEEEVLGDGSDPFGGQIGEAFNADESNDFSDLFDQPAGRPDRTNDADLNDLFEDELPENTPEPAQALGLPPVPSEASTQDDLDDIFASDLAFSDLALDDPNLGAATPASEVADLFGDLDLDSPIAPDSELSLDEFSFASETATSQPLSNLDGLFDDVADDRRIEAETSDRADPFRVDDSTATPPAAFDPFSLESSADSGGTFEMADLWQDDALPIAPSASTWTDPVSLEGLGLTIEDENGGGDLLSDDSTDHLTAADSLEELINPDDLDFSDLLGSTTSQAQPPIEDLTLEELTDDEALDFSGDWLNDTASQTDAAQLDRALEDAPPAAVPDPWDTYIPAHLTQGIPASDSPDLSLTVPPSEQTDLTADLWSGSDAHGDDALPESFNGADPFSIASGSNNFGLTEADPVHGSGGAAIEELSLEDDFSFDFDDLGSSLEPGQTTGTNEIEELSFDQTRHPETAAIEELSLEDDFNFDLGDLGLDGLESDAGARPEAIEELSLEDDLNFDLGDLGLNSLADQSNSVAADFDDLKRDSAANSGDLELDAGAGSDGNELFADSEPEALDFFLDGAEPVASEATETLSSNHYNLAVDSDRSLVGEQLELSALDLDLDQDLSAPADPDATVVAPTIGQNDFDFLDSFSSAPSSSDLGAIDLESSDDDFLNFESSLSEESSNLSDDLLGLDDLETSGAAIENPPQPDFDLFGVAPESSDRDLLSGYDSVATESLFDDPFDQPSTPEGLDLSFEDDLFGSDSLETSDLPDSLRLDDPETPEMLQGLDLLDEPGFSLDSIASSPPDLGRSGLEDLGLEDLDADVTLMNGLDLDQDSLGLEALTFEDSDSTAMPEPESFDFSGLDESFGLNGLDSDNSPVNAPLSLESNLGESDFDQFDFGSPETDSLNLSENLSAADGLEDDWFNLNSAEQSLDAEHPVDSEIETDFGLAAPSDEMDLFQDDRAFGASQHAAIDTSLGFEENNDLAGLDQFLSAETTTPGEFDDLEEMLGAGAADPDHDMFAELDDLPSNEGSAHDFSDLDQLLETEESGPAAFGDLDDLLGPAAVAAAAIGAAGIVNHLSSRTSPSQPATQPATTDDFTDLDALLQGMDSSPNQANRSIEAAPDFGFDELDDLLKDAEEKLPGSPSVKSNRGVAAQARRSARPGRGFVEQTMRVPVKHLDNLSNLVGELVVNRNSLEEDQERLRQSLDNLLYQVQQLSDVGQRMQDLYERSLLESSLLASRQGSRSPGISLFRDSQIATQTASSTGVEYDPLEMDRFTGFHSLSQEMIELIVRVRESSSDIEFIVDETDQVTRMFRQVTTQLQEGLTRSRMVPFAQTADRLPRAVRDISMQVGKQVELQIEGRETLIDKMILEQLYDPMTHLVNNALTHGIESPDVRRAAGKSAVGRITIRAFHQGNQTIISVSDDGAGIDVERVKAKAIEKGVLTPSEANAMSRLDVYDLLFQAGFSTKDQADDFSGRGVGMDVVRTSLSEIRGVVNTDSTPGKGTSFTIRLPLTLSISKALCCISDRARVAFPMDGVEDMLDLPKERLQTNAEGKPCISWRDSVLQLYPLSELLGYNRHLSRGNVYGGNQEDDITSIVVLRSAGNFLALQVDQVLGEQEIVIKQLEGPIPKPIGVAGATVLGDGRIMPIADVLELIDLSMGRIRKDAGGSLWDQGAATAMEPQVVKTEPTVLIVDDSITVRELLSMTFNKVGYRVEQARDGQEAWEKLRSGLPCDIVFCDIEMPRMDGLELLSRIQKDPSLNHLPIAMLTSRGADRHRQMAASLGANGYFTKPYLEEALLDAAQRMLKGEVLLTPNNSNS